MEESTVKQIVESLKGIPIRNEGQKVRRNDICPCNSGLKFKKCCLKRGKND